MYNRALSGRFVAMVAVGLLLAGCASVTVDRMAVDETVDLSGRWNDTDSRLVSEEMVSDVLSRPWIDRYRGGKGKRPGGDRWIGAQPQRRTHKHRDLRQGSGTRPNQLRPSGIRLLPAASEEKFARKERTRRRMPPKPLPRKRVKRSVPISCSRGPSTPSPIASKARR